MKLNLIIPLVLIVVAVILGVVAALVMDRQPNQTSTDTSRGRILEIKLGSYNTNKQGQQSFKEKSDFTANENISLRVKASNIDQDIAMPVRLLDSAGRVITLSPSTVNIKNGETRFCCWTVRTAGKYTLQIFRPEGVVTSLPLDIQKEYNTSK